MTSSNKTVSFADVAHQMLQFETSELSSRLILELIDTRWMQRLRYIRQTGNTNLVYMFAEHSRFGHSLGVAYLATLLMKKLASAHPDQVQPYRNAVAAAALLHDIGHVAPGSHLAERLWGKELPGKHEEISKRVILEDPEISKILNNYQTNLPDLVCQILAADPGLPPWTSSIISGGGWNADRGNWAIVDSAMCSVSYGRYNVTALIDAFCLSDQGELVLQESRLDALTHFFVARDSMYRQVYQHRVLQAADVLNENIIHRLRDLQLTESIIDLEIFLDQTMLKVLSAKNYLNDLELHDIFRMTENWWLYHLEQWCECKDKVLADLSQMLRDRRLFKTIRVDTTKEPDTEKTLNVLLRKTTEVATSLGFDPQYYVALIDDADKHRHKIETPPLVLLDSGKIVPVTEIEPLVAKLLEPSASIRKWIAVPKTVKDKLEKVR